MTSVGATGSSSLLQPSPQIGQSLSSPRGTLQSSSSQQPPAASLQSRVEATAPATKGGKGLDSDPIESRGNPEITVLMKIKRISQRFLLLSPHAFIAMSFTFVWLNYVMGTENLAYSGATFVGVGGMVYCLVSPIFREFLPQYILPHKENKEFKPQYNTWNWIINLTWTGCITTIFTSAVWKLPDITTTQGLFFLGFTFFAPFPFLSKLYPDTVDKQESYWTLKYGNRTS